MRRSVNLVLLATVFIVGACQTERALDRSMQIVPQAQPVFAWLKATRSGDQELLKTVFSDRMRTKFDVEGWGKVLKAYQEVFKEEFGDYKLEEFAFQFTGGEEEGQVSLVHNGKKLPGGVRVIKEEADWKVDERRRPTTVAEPSAAPDPGGS